MGSGQDETAVLPFYSNTRVWVVGLILIALLAVGLWWGGETTWDGLMAIQTHPSQLISDYVAVAGPGPALVNASLAALAGLVLVLLARVDVTGPTAAGVFTILGFGLFGKNIVNILPIFLGVWLYAKVVKSDMKHYILPALFGTALGPVVSHIAFATGLGLVGGITAGLVVGFIMPGAGAHMLRNHQGLNLYNLGFTAGFLGLFIAAMLRGLGNPVSAMMLWDVDYSAMYGWLLLGLCAALIIVGLFLSKWRIKGCWDIMKETGKLATDFVSIAGFGPTLINMGLVGLLGIGYLVAIGGDFNGPTAGGVLTMIGFGAFGKHLRNCVPVMAGVWLGTFIFQWGPSDPGAQLAVLFGTTLAPVSMQFGPLIGVAAGVVHLIVVHNAGAIHGGLNLYNNGFAGGLVATAIVAIYRGLGKDV